MHIFQNSGAGNSINAICSLLNYYKLPVLFVISHRGSKGEKIAAQVPMGDITEQLLLTAGVKVSLLMERKNLTEIKGIVSDMRATATSHALLVPISFW